MNLKALYSVITSIALFFAFSASVSAQVADFGDHRSETITTKAWQALGAGQHDLAITYTDKCIELYLGEAQKMQAGLTAPAPSETAATMWALNDVGTCLYIRGQALEALGRNAEASESYKTLAETLSFAQTWDTNPHSSPASMY